MGLPLHGVVEKVSTVAENGQDNSTYVRRLRNKILRQSVLDCLFFFWKAVLPLRINKAL